MKKYIEDILIFSGLAVIVGTTFSLSKIAGFYTLGALLVIIGLLITKVQRVVRK